MLPRAGCGHTGARADTVQQMTALQESPARPAPARTAARPGWWAALLLCLAAFAVVGTHVASYPAFSPIDEFQHYDYVVKVLHGERPETGERVGPEAMAEESCRGVDAPGVVLPPCGVPSDQRPELYQEAGFNTAAGHTPAYYLVTGVLARAVQALSPLGLLPAARLVGGLWLAAGLLLTLAAGRAAGASTTALTGAALWATGTPGLLHALSTVNPDSTALAAGGLLLLAALRWDRGTWPLWALCAAAATATTLKVTNILGVLAIAVLLLLLAGTAQEQPAERMRASLRRVPPLLLVGVAAALPQVAWTLVNARTATVDASTIPMTQRFTVAHLGLPELIGNVPAAVFPASGYVPAFLGVSVFVGLAASGFGWLVLGGIVGGALGPGAPRAADDGKTDGRGPAIARAALLLGLLGGPLIVLLTYVSASVYFPIPSRYGLSLLPLMLVAVGCLARGVWVGRTLLVLGSLAPLAVLSAAF